jgi:hypothetical protein
MVNFQPSLGVMLEDTKLARSFNRQRTQVFEIWYEGSSPSRAIWYVRLVHKALRLSI